MPADLHSWQAQERQRLTQAQAAAQQVRGPG